MQSRSQRALALVGPGRAGTTVAAALVARRLDRGRGGRTRSAAPSTRAAADRLGASRVAEVADAGRDADLVIVATPDAAIADTAAALAPSLRAGALVVHLSGACPLDELDKLRVARPDVEVGSLHPLQSLAVGRGRRSHASRARGARSTGPPTVERLALSLGMRPFRVDPATGPGTTPPRPSRPTTWSRCSARRRASPPPPGVPPEALLPLVRATVDNVDALGPADALTGPVARGDVDTVRRHLDALPADEQRGLPRAGARGARAQRAATIAALRRAACDG